MADSFLITDDSNELILLAKANFPINQYIDIPEIRIVVLCMLTTNGTDLRFSLQFDNTYSSEIKGAVLDRIIDYVETFNIKFDYFFVGFDSPQQTLSLLSSFHHDKYTRSSNPIIYESMKTILTNKYNYDYDYDDYTCIKYLDDDCVSTTFKIPDIDDIIRVGVCRGDVLCISNKNAFHSQPYVETNKPERKWYDIIRSEHDNKQFGEMDKE